MNNKIKYRLIPTLKIEASLTLGILGIQNFMN